MSRRAVLSLPVILSLVNCGPASAPPVQPPAPSAPPTYAMPGPAPTTATPAPPVAPPPPLVGRPLPPAVKALTPYLRGNGTRGFFGWSHGLPVVGSFGWGSRALAVPDADGRYRVDERSWAGVDTTVIHGAEGSFDERALLVGLTDTGRAVGEGELFVREAPNRAWKKTKRLRRFSYFQGLEPFTGGRVIAYVEPRGFVHNGDRPRIIVVDGPPMNKGLPQPTVVDVKDWRGRTVPEAAVSPQGFHAFPTSGHAYAIGRKKVEWWAPGQSKGTVFDLPGEHFWGQTSTEDGDHGVYVTRKTGILHVVGTEVTALDYPEAFDFEKDANIAYTSDGSLWLASEKPDQLWRRDPSGIWRRIALDGKKNRVRSMATRGDQIWLAVFDQTARYTWTGEGLYYTILWNGPARDEVPTVRFNSSWRAQYASEGDDPPKPAREGCESIFVLFYGITKYAAPGYDFPLARKALTGQKDYSHARFVKTLTRGQKFFGAFVNDLARGRRLAQLISAKVKGSTPQVLCHTPTVLAELPIDLSNGTTTGWKEATPSE